VREIEGLAGTRRPAKVTMLRGRGLEDLFRFVDGQAFVNGHQFRLRGRVRRMNPHDNVSDEQLELVELRNAAERPPVGFDGNRIGSSELESLTVLVKNRLVVGWRRVGFGFARLHLFFRPEFVSSLRVACRGTSMGRRVRCGTQRRSASHHTPGRSPNDPR